MTGVQRRWCNGIRELTRSSASDSQEALAPGEGPESQPIRCQGSDYHGRVNKTAHS